MNGLVFRVRPRLVAALLFVVALLSGEASAAAAQAGDDAPQPRRSDRAAPATSAPVRADDSGARQGSFLPSRTEEDRKEHRLLAVGGSVRLASPTNDRLDDRVTAGPIVRLGSGTGLGVSVGFSWTSAGLHDAAGADTGARVNIKPVMAGVGYTVRRGRTSATLSVVAGPAFNGLSGGRRSGSDGVPQDVGNSFAWRPGVSLWYDANSRVAFNLFGGYLVTRPSLTVLQNDLRTTRDLRADTAFISVGAVYKVY